MVLWQGTKMPSTQIGLRLRSGRGQDNLVAAEVARAQARFAFDAALVAAQMAPSQS
jgi:hypothetical protein